VLLLFSALLLAGSITPDRSETDELYHLAGSQSDIYHAEKLLVGPDVTNPSHAYDADQSADISYPEQYFQGEEQHVVDERVEDGRYLQEVYPPQAYPPPGEHQVTQFDYQGPYDQFQQKREGRSSRKHKKRSSTYQPYQEQYAQ